MWSSALLPATTTVAAQLGVAWWVFWLATGFSAFVAVLWRLIRAAVRSDRHAPANDTPGASSGGPGADES